MNRCYHCHTPFSFAPHRFDKKIFCCLGCQTVYQLLQNHELSTFYDLVSKGGNIPDKPDDRYAFLEEPSLAQSFITFEEGNHVKSIFSIPSIHCSACLWVLEQLYVFDPGVLHAQVEFVSKTLYLSFDKNQTTLRSIAQTLASLGYPPDLSLGQKPLEKKNSKRLLMQLGIAGFAFGNCMFLSLSTYFDAQEYWILQFRPWFDWLSLLMSLPVILVAAQDYFLGAWKGLKVKQLTLNVPIALGIIALFGNSIYASFFLHKLGYFDSLTGLVFFLLIGKFMQQKVYSRFSYDRDYTSFFPLGINKIEPDGKRQLVPLKQLKVGDQIALRVGSLVPVDCLLESSHIQLDYSFVTGEATPVDKRKGDLLYAGGKIEKQSGVARVLKPVLESQLIQLWKQPAFEKKEKVSLHSLTDRISRFFTPVILLFAFGVSAFWFWIDASRMIEIFTAILIVACPCALALSAPFVWGHLLRYFDQLSCFPRNIETLEKLAQIDHIVVDKTGTLTDPSAYSVSYEGAALKEKELSYIKSVVYQSDHPLSNVLFKHLSGLAYDTSIYCTHHLGKGIEATINNQKIKLGSAAFVGALNLKKEPFSTVYLAINEHCKGHFIMKPAYRPALSRFFKQLQKYPITLLSGDTAKITKEISKKMPKNSTFYFNQSPFQKVDFISKQQKKGHRILMIGDGLNDAGALQQSDVGLAVHNQTQAFTPACDLIMYGKNLFQLPHFLVAVQRGQRLIYWSIALSFAYNIVGLSVAAMGYLTPLVAAVLMPLSSISVMLFATLSTFVVFKKLKNKLKT